MASPARACPRCGSFSTEERGGGPAAEGLPPSLRAVAELVAAGLGDKEIAAELSVPLATVRTYVARCYRRLGLRSRVELARWVWRREVSRRPSE